MADMEEKLNQLLSDPASMQKVLNLASGILGAQKGQSPAAPAETDHAPPGARRGRSRSERPAPLPGQPQGGSSGRRGIGTGGARARRAGGRW